MDAASMMSGCQWVSRLMLGAADDSRANMDIAG